MKKIDYSGIGQRIRHIRRAHSMSQEELASRIDISVTHMSHIETGNTKLSLQVLVDIARELHVTTDDLIYDKTEINETSIAPHFVELVHGCSPEDSKILFDILKSAKIALEKYR